MYALISPNEKQRNLYRVAEVAKEPFDVGDNIETVLKAPDWAEKMDGPVEDTGETAKYSAKYWAEQAALLVQQLTP